MPIPFGWIFRTGKVAYDAYAIPKRIEKLESELQRPLTAYFEGLELCYAKISLEQIQLFKEIAKIDKTSKSKLVEEYFGRIRQILMQNEEDLKDIPATRFDIEVLAVTMQETAIVIDENLKEFDVHSKEVFNLHEKSIKDSKLTLEKNLLNFNDNSKKIFAQHEEALKKIKTWKIMTFSLIAVTVGLIILNIYILLK